MCIRDSYQVDKDKLKKVKLMITESKLSEKDKEIQNLIADGLLELLNPDKPCLLYTSISSQFYSKRKGALMLLFIMS